MVYIVIIHELFETRALKSEILLLWAQRTSGFFTFCSDIKHLSKYVQISACINRLFPDHSAGVLA